MDERIRLDVVERILRALVELNPNALPDERPTPEELATAGDAWLLHRDLERERHERVMPLFELIAPYMKRGAKDWSEFADVMSEEDLLRYAELLEQLHPGDLGGPFRPGSE